MKTDINNSVDFVMNDKDFPVFNEKDITVPVTLALMKHDFGLTQMRALIRVFEKIQDVLKKMYHTNSKNAMINPKDRSLQLIFDCGQSTQFVDNHYKILAKLKDLNPSGINNVAFERALISMGLHKISLPVKIKGHEFGLKEKDITFMEYTNFCDILINKEKKRNTLVILKFKPEVAEKLISTDFGFLKTYASVYEHLKGTKSALMYLLLSKFKDKSCIQMKIKTFREYTKTTNTYKDWRLLCLHTLEEPKRDLDKLFENGLSDLTFSYEKVYKRAGQNTGEPVYVKIYIKKRLQLTQKDYEERVKYCKTMVERWLRESFKMTDEKKIKRYVSLTTPENFFEVQDKFNYIYDIVADTKKSSKIIDKKAYILTSIDNLFKEIASTPEVE